MDHQTIMDAQITIIIAIIIFGVIVSTRSKSLIYLTTFVIVVYAAYELLGFLFPGR